MCLRYHGCHVPTEELRKLIGIDRDGADAAALLRAGRELGLEGTGVKLSLDQLDLLKPGAILHWKFRHFVVFDQLRRGWICIVDPATGPRRLSREEFGRCFTGVALLFEPNGQIRRNRREGLSLGRYLRRIASHRGVLLRILTTSLLLQLFALSMPLLTGLVVDRVVPRGDLSLLRLVTAGTAVVIVFQLLATLVRSQLFIYLRNRLDAELTIDLQDRMLDLPYSFFQARTAGDLMTRLNSSTTVRDMLTSSVLSTILDGSMIGLYLVLLFAGSPGMVLLVLALGAVRIGVFAATRRRQKELMSEELQKQALANGHQYQLLSGIQVLKACGAEQRASEQWRGFFLDMLATNLERGKLSAWVDAVMAALSIGSPLVILLYGAHQVLAGNLSLGAMLALSAVATGFLGPLSTLVSTAFDLQVVRSYIERIEDVLNSSPEQDPKTVVPAHNLQGAIALESVSYRYGPRRGNVLSDVSLEIEPGQFVAIVGRSGAGKSTLAHLMVGLYTPTTGRLLLDGVDQRELELRSVRRQFGIVPQQTFLFGATIRDVITMGSPGATHAEVVRAARRAVVHDEIERLPLGYDTALGDNGDALAGGQRQRIALARALVGRPKILLLDEATSDLDLITERRVYDNLAREGCTQIVIAHRLGSIREADVIVVLDRGKVAEIGSHEALIEENGHYAELIAVQKNGGQAPGRLASA